MEILYRFFSGAAAGMAALFAPVVPLAACTVGFIAVDFVSGVAADRKMALREGRRWYFESRRAWRTVRKAGFAVLCIALAWLLEHWVLAPSDLHPARLFAGFICGVELWSFLENAAVVSRAPLFRRLGVYVDNKLKRYEDKQRNSES